jgi:hypothetical protein
MLEPFDPDDPPAEPPEGCVDPLLWRVGFALLATHHPRPDGFCECKVFWPCHAARLAEEALLAAYDRSVPRPRLRATNLGRWA